MKLIEYIGYRLDTAVEMLNQGKPRDECACYLMNLKKDLLGKEKIIVDEDKRKYLESKEEEIMECEKDCLSCGHSFSEPKEDGNDVLHCMISDGKEVPDDGFCDDWN